MSERDFPGVKEVARVCAAAAVNWITCDRVAEVFQMDSDLVGAAGVRVALDERFPLVRRAQSVACERIAPAFHDGHSLAVDGVAADRGIDFSMGHAESAIDQCQVGLVDFS